MPQLFSPLLLLLITAAVAVVLVVVVRLLARREPPWRLQHTLRVIMIGALSVGTCTHLENFWRAGYLPLPRQPLVFNLYWTALTVFDPLAATLLVVRPRAGLVISVLIMLSDISINAYAFPPTAALQAEWPFLLQVAFALFLFGVTPYCWRSLYQSQSPRRESAMAAGSLANRPR